MRIGRVKMLEDVEDCRRDDGVGDGEMCPTMVSRARRRAWRWFGKDVWRFDCCSSLLRRGGLALDGCLLAAGPAAPSRQGLLAAAGAFGVSGTAGTSEWRCATSSASVRFRVVWMTGKSGRGSDGRQKRRFTCLAKTCIPEGLPRPKGNGGNTHECNQDITIDSSSYLITHCHTVHAQASHALVPIIRV